MIWGSVITVYWYRSGSALSRLIQRVTRAQYSHVAIDVQIAGYGEGDLYEALGSGILHRAGAARRERIAASVACRTLEVSRENAVEAEAWLERHVAHGYSWLGFAAAGLGALTGWRLKVALDGEYICSGLAARALEIAGVAFDHDPETMTPGELALELGTDQDADNTIEPLAA